MKFNKKHAVSVLLTAVMSISVCGTALAKDNADLSGGDNPTITVPGDNDPMVDGGSGGGGGYSLRYGNTLKEEEEPFIDVDEDDWFYEDVVYVYKNGLMSGTSDNEFSPYHSLTRGMAAAILYRLAGSPQVEYDDVFDDLEDGQWYTDGMIWAVNEGIIAGYGDGTCGPEKLVTIEQLASILYRYAGSPATDAERLSKKAILGEISDYAVPAMEWAAENGMLYGEPIRPTAPASRAETARMFTVLAKMK